MDDLELAPTAMAAGGAAIARDPDGRVVFVEGALPGERVRARILEVKKDFCRAVTVDVMAPSADRLAPPCTALSAGCGGCPWQHVRPEAQPRLKAEIVADALRRIGRLDGPDLVPVRVRPPLDEGRSLRTTVRLGVGTDDRAGQRRRASHDIVPTDACGAAHPLLEELIVSGRYAGATEVLMRVGLASGERNVLAVPSGRRVVVPADVVVGGHGMVHERIAGAWLRVSIGSFFQSSAAAASQLVEAVIEAVGDAAGGGGHLVDAYAGVGLFGATVGGALGARVTAIESDAIAVADARVNLAHLEATVVQGEMGKWRLPPAQPKVDVVVADPARSGLGRPGVAAVVATAAPRVVLVSCDPASLARDARLLSDGGYRLVDVELIDVFPDTFHVETISRFDLAGGRHPTNRGPG